MIGELYVASLQVMNAADRFQEKVIERETRVKLMPPLMVCKMTTAVRITMAQLDHTAS